MFVPRDRNGKCPSFTYFYVLITENVAIVSSVKIWCQRNFFVRLSSFNLPNSKNVFYYFLVITTGVPRRVSRLRDSCHNNYMMMLIYAFMFFILLEISILSAFTENVQARSRKKCHCTPICKKVIESIVYLEKKVI